MLNEKLFLNGETIAVACSGGKDSMFLLNSLLQLKDRCGITVKVINIDHSIRGKESERDSLFVKEFCDKRHIDLLFKKIDCLQFSKNNGLSDEEGARQLRYECFFSSIKSGFCDKVATA